MIICEDFTINNISSLIEKASQKPFGEYTQNIKKIDSNSEYYTKKIIKKIHGKNTVSLGLLNNNETLEALIIAKKSEWDSKKFGIDIWRITDAIFNQRIKKIEIQLLISKFKKKISKSNANVFFSRINLDNFNVINALINEGSMICDILITRSLKISEIKNKLESKNPNNDHGVYPAAVEDIQYCKEISRNAFRFDHFHVDPKLNKEKCDELYAEWLQKNFEDDQGFILVRKDEQGIMGFISCKTPSKLSEGVGNIELIAVDKHYQNMGVANNLIQQALEVFKEKTSSVIVGTQASNITAMRLYEKFGFRTISSEVTLHTWIKDP